MIESGVESFLGHLWAVDTAALATPGTPVFDPWHGVNGDDALANAARHRRERLRSFLRVAGARLVLVGEAPGYQGCRISGIPFTSEALLLEGGTPRVRVPRGRLSTRCLPWREPSATIIWQTLRELGLADTTVLWNAFPWHPHKPGSPHSNRPVTPAERGAGRACLERLLGVYPRARVVSVGRVAQALLAEMGMDAPYVRHPANGGASRFRHGVTGLVR